MFGDIHLTEATPTTIDDDELARLIAERGSLDLAFSNGLTPDAIDDPLTRVMCREAFDRWQEFRETADHLIAQVTTTDKAETGWNQPLGYLAAS